MARPSCIVAIVGCGLGGIIAAIGIKKAGHQVTVFEQASALIEIGAGIQIPCNSARILQRWNLLSPLEPYSTRGSNINLRTYKDGTILSRQNLIPFVEETYNAPYLVAHRADFLNVLTSEALRLGVIIRLGSRVAELDFDTPAIRLSSGERFQADAVIGADGLRSSCREALLGRPDPPYFTGEMGYRLTVSTKEIEGDAELTSLVRSSDLHCWMGPNAHAVGYQLKKGGLFNIFLSSPDDLPSGVDVMEVDIEEVITKLKGWDLQLRNLVSLAEGALKWRLQSSHGTNSWCHPSGKVALLGDACHASLPYLGQGAAQAAEDGAVLGSLFAKLRHKSQIPDLLRLYESIRIPRTTRIVECSSSMRGIFNLPDGDKQRERDRQLAHEQPFEGYPNRWADPVFQKWLLGYDTEAEVEKAWEKYEKEPISEKTKQ
ncbi:MAG: hypothetical protein Q9187_004602 [Circinaria calcarea]